MFKFGQLNDFGTRFDVHRVLVVDRLNVPERRVNFREFQDKWPHLADLELTEVSVTRVRYSLEVMSQKLLYLLRLDVDPKVLLLVFALNWGGLLLVVYLVILKTVNLFTRFIWQPLMKCFMKQSKLGGGPRTLDVDMTVMCSVLSKMKRC